MSLRSIFNKLFFKKHKPGKVVATKGDKVFQKLEAISPEPPKPPTITLDPSNFDLSILVALGLKPGTHTITVTASAPSLQLTESDRSDSVEYTVK